MKREWKGALIGGGAGIVTSLLIIIFGSSDDIFRMPLNLVLNRVCNPSICSDVTGFVIFSLIFTFIFYSLLFALMGVVISKFFSGNKKWCLFLLILSFMPLTMAYTYEHSLSLGDTNNVNIATAIRLDNFTLPENKNNTQISIKYNPVWDDYILDSSWKVRGDTDLIMVMVGILQSDVELNDIYFLDANDGDKVVAYTGWTERVRTSPLPWGTLFYVNKTWFKHINNQIAMKVSFDIYLNPFDNKEGPVYIQDNAPELPKLNNWYCGDTHYHSDYTYTNFLNVWGEIGAPIPMTLSAADSLDFDWVTITDHSNSFNAHKDDNFSWYDFKAECNDYSKCLIGEEINCNPRNSGSSLPGNHFLAYNPNNAILDDGTNAQSCSNVIRNISSQGSFGYVAHPESSDDIIIPDLIITKWQNYSLPFTGLEVWNGGINSDLDNGIGKWKNLILGGRKVFISAGSDAHGDLNTAFGKEYTCVYAPSYSKSNIFNGLKNGNSYMSNNGALTLKINDKILGEEINISSGTSFTMKIDYNLESSCYLRVYKGVIGQPIETNISLGLLSAGQGSTIYTDTPTANSYYRAECINSDGSKRVYTNPIWVNVKECNSQWNCSEWSNCICGNQNRTCRDLNSCGTNNKPLEIRTCSYNSVWSCGNWGECLNDFQHRVCTELNSCNSSSIESRDCSMKVDIISPIQDNYDSGTLAFNITSTIVMKKLEYKESQSTMWITLCTNCQNYSGRKRFTDGQHNLDVRASSIDGQTKLTNVSFFVDSRDPQISTTAPLSNSYTNGSNFYIKYSESNLNSAELEISSPMVTKPKVELFVMTYCPYGIQAEKGIIPAVKALGTKIDFKIRFTHFFIHGDQEEQETYRQICIREEQKTKFILYVECFVQDGNATRCLSKLGINVDSCIANRAKYYYSLDSSMSQSYGVVGSPTFFINGKETDFYPRSSANALKIICNSFDNKSSACGLNLSSENPQPGFGNYDHGAINSASLDSEPSGGSSGGGSGGSSCASGMNRNCTFNIDLSEYDARDIVYSFYLEDVAGNFKYSRNTTIKVDTTSPQITKFIQKTIGNYVTFNISIVETNFYRVNYMTEGMTRWSILCSSLRYGDCVVRKYFKSGNHNITIQVIDKAGNSEIASKSFVV
jgi:hypothetical protein